MQRADRQLCFVNALSCSVERQDLKGGAFFTRRAVCPCVQVVKECNGRRRKAVAFGEEDRDGFFRGRERFFRSGLRHEDSDNDRFFDYRTRMDAYLFGFRGLSFSLFPSS